MLRSLSGVASGLILSLVTIAAVASIALYMDRIGAVMEHSVEVALSKPVRFILEPLGDCSYSDQLRVRLRVFAAKPPMHGVVEIVSVETGGIVKRVPLRAGGFAEFVIPCYEPVSILVNINGFVMPYRYDMDPTKCLSGSIVRGIDLLKPCDPVNSATYGVGASSSDALGYGSCPLLIDAPIYLALGVEAEAYRGFMPTSFIEPRDWPAELFRKLLHGYVPWKIYDTSLGIREAYKPDQESRRVVKETVFDFECEKVYVRATYRWYSNFYPPVLNLTLWTSDGEYYSRIISGFGSYNNKLMSIRLTEFNICGIKHTFHVLIRPSWYQTCALGHCTTHFDAIVIIFYEVNYSAENIVYVARYDGSDPRITLYYAPSSETILVFTNVGLEPHVCVIGPYGSGSIVFKYVYTYYWNTRKPGVFISKYGCPHARSVVIHVSTKTLNQAPPGIDRAILYEQCRQLPTHQSQYAASTERTVSRITLK